MVMIRVPEETHDKIKQLTWRERKKFLYQAIEGAIDRALAELDAAEKLQRERREEGR